MEVKADELLEQFDRLQGGPWNFIYEHSRSNVQNIARQIEGQKCLPYVKDIFRPFVVSDPSNIRVVIMGQDPYPGIKKGIPDADGMAFSSRYNYQLGRPLPGSLRNMLDELERTHDIAISNGNLYNWVDKGVILLNASLTLPVDGGKHDRNWKQFIVTVLNELYAFNPHIVLAFLGKQASKLHSEGFLENCRFSLVRAPHPSPLNTYRPFIGSNFFKEIDDSLIEMGLDPIDWQI